jgi:long-chain acyl-CoA synthetase
MTTETTTRELGLVDHVRTWADTRTDHIAVRWEGGELTYREFFERACRLAGALADMGIAKGDRVAILDKNGPAHLEVLVGAPLIGAVGTPVNFRLVRSEIEAVVRDAQARVLVAGSEFRADAEAVADALGVPLYVIDAPEGDPQSYEAWIGAQEPTDPGISPAMDDVACQLYSSGTTGLPKGAELTHANLRSSLTNYGRFADFKPDSVNLAPLPMFHIGGGGVALAGLWAGVTNRLVRDVVPGELLDTIEKERVTHAALVPTIIGALLQVPGVESRDLSSWEICLYGASPISPALLAQAVRVLGCKFAQGYGLTETTGIAVLLPPEDHDPDGANAHRLRAAGRPVHGMEAKIVVPGEDREAPVGEIGEIWLRGANVMKGYFNNPEETAKAITPDGWFKTGDAGRMDADGYIYIEDRVKDMIVSGGENIYPFEIEAKLLEHPAIQDVAVIGVPHERWGETPKAMVVLAEGRQLTEQEVIDFAKQHLASYKCPTSVDFLDELPRSPTGKILKKELRKPFWEGRERLVS